MGRFLFLSVTFLWAFSCSPKKQVYSFQGETMGTYYSVKVAADSDLDRTKLSAHIESRLKRLNSIFSTYDPGSELSKLNQAKAKTVVEITDEMEDVLLTSKEVYQKTQGYFDVTVGPVVNAWGFGPESAVERPDLAELEDLEAKIGMDLFEVKDGNKFEKSKKDLYIDLSAIAKGYAVDRLFASLQEKGFKSILVEIGGETRALGRKPSGAPWLVGIEKPSDKLGQEIQAVVKLEDLAIATSGSYRNFKEYGDQVFSHTIDPTTLRPAQHKLISVTVLAPACAIADAYATAMLAMGVEKALLLAKKLRLPAYFLVKKGANVDILMTDSFKQYLQEI